MNTACHIRHAPCSWILTFVRMTKARCVARLNGRERSVRLVTDVEDAVGDCEKGAVQLEPAGLFALAHPGEAAQIPERDPDPLQLHLEKGLAAELGVAGPD